MCIVKNCDQKRYYKNRNENFVVKILTFRFPTDSHKYKQQTFSYFEFFFIFFFKF